MQEQLVSVYGLEDRRNHEIFYIGMSANPYVRYGQHLAFPGDSAKGNRIVEMQKEGLFPELVLLEKDLPYNRASEQERYWIRHYLALGVQLTNRTKTLPLKLCMTKQKPDTWISGTAALAVPKGNSGRDDIPESYVRILAKKGKIAKRPSPNDTRANEYLLSDVESYRVKRRDGSKGETRAARAAGGRRKASAGGNSEESAA